MRIQRITAVLLLLILAVSSPAVADTSQVEQLLAVAIEQLGTPYELFSNAPESCNCLTFVTYCFNQVADGTFSGKSIECDYEKITSIKELKPGDIVCFKNSSRLKGILGYHFGIYVGRGYFIHASNSVWKVTVDKLSKYRKRFLGAVRTF